MADRQATRNASHTLQFCGRRKRCPIGGISYPDYSSPELQRAAIGSGFVDWGSGREAITRR